MIYAASRKMNRAGQLCEVAPCYAFLASDDSSYMTGQMLHPMEGRFPVLKKIRQLLFLGSRLVSAFFIPDYGHL